MSECLNFNVTFSRTWEYIFFCFALFFNNRYKDFIRYLPVHLAKFILSRLDKATLYNALCVSKNWRKLAEEVHKEFFVNQQLLEEVMLMQVGGK